MPRLTITTKDNIGDDWVNIARRASRPSSAEQRPVEQSIRSQFARNFAREGSDAGAWAPLAPFTVAQRLALGFPGPHPILVRTGRYRRSYTQSGSGNALLEFSPTAGGWEMVVGSDDERAAELEFGTDRIPPRPVTLLDGQQENAVLDAVDHMFDAIVRQETA